MPRRFFGFLLTFILVIGWTIAAPFADRATREAENTPTTPSPSPGGYRAFYQLLESLGPNQTSQWQRSLINLPASQPQVIWFLEPGAGIFFDGPGYTRHMQALAKNGGHLIFVLDAHTAQVPDEAGNPKQATDYLNKWYDLSLSFEKTPVPQDLDLPVISHFPHRNIQTLAYREPQLKRRFSGPAPAEQEAPALLAFSDTAVGKGTILLETLDHMPLAVRYPYGDGDITIFPNALFLKNSQLSRADNAALGVALQENWPPMPVKFEVYSAGFNENRDIFSYLAAGNGISLLITLVSLLGLGGALLVNQPVRWIASLKTSNDRQFTQEAFVSALAGHYLNTRNWQQLYRRLQEHIAGEIRHRFPGRPWEACLQAIAQSPFYAVSLKDLEEAFADIPVPSQEAFMRRSQALLALRQKVIRHEQPQTNRRLIPPAPGARFAR